MRALVLTGGSVKGAFQAGVLSAMASVEPSFDLIIGTSVGAINAAVLGTMCKSKADQPQAFRSIEGFWKRHVQTPSDLVRHRGYVNIAVDILRDRWGGLVDVVPLEKLAMRFVGVRKHEDMKVAVCSVNMRTARLKYTYQDEPDFFDHMMASAMIPGIMPPRMVDGDLWQDGGLREVGPMTQALMLGATEVTVIACQPLHPDTWMKKPTLLNLIDRSTTIMVNELLANDIASTGSAIPIQVFRPLEDLQIDITNFTQAQIYDLVQLGRESYWGGPTSL